MWIVIIFLFLVLAGVLWLLFRYFSQSFSLVFGKTEQAVYLGSFGADLALMDRHLRLDSGKRLVDLGCGDGKALRFFVRRYGVKGIGYDFNHFAISYGKLLNKMKWYDITLVYSDFLKADLHNVDYIYLYLFPGQMVNIEHRLFDHIGPDTIVISNTFLFHKHIPFETIKDRKGKERIRLYRK